MIDISKERVVSLTRAPRHLPPRRRAKRPNVATLYRWAQKGVRGVVLETIQVGGTKCTSLEALQRFCDRLSAPEPRASHSASASAEAAGATERALEREGL